MGIDPTSVIIELKPKSSGSGSGSGSGSNILNATYLTYLISSCLLKIRGLTIFFTSIFIVRDT